MRILIVSNLKNKGYGESTRPYYLGKGLAEAGHRVLQICVSAPESEDGIKYQPRMPFGDSGSFISRILNFFSLFITAHLFRPDIIYVQQLNNWNWVRETRAFPKAVKVYDAHTSAFMEARAFGEPEEALKVVKHREQLALSEADLVVTVSQETRDFFLDEFDASADRITIVKNATCIEPVENPVTPKNEKLNCVSILPLDGFPSNDMAMEMLLNIAKLTEAKDSDVLFTVIGGGKHPDPKSTNVHYTGYVEDLEAEILKADICLVSYPEGAVCGGPRNKVCDFFALAQCVVSTKEGMRGFDDCHPDKHYVLGDSLEEFSQAILDLKADSEKRNQLKTTALEMGHVYQWPRRAKEVEAIFQKLV